MGREQDIAHKQIKNLEIGRFFIDINGLQLGFLVQDHSCYVIAMSLPDQLPYHLPAHVGKNIWEKIFFEILSDRTRNRLKSQ